MMKLEGGLGIRRMDNYRRYLMHKDSVIYKLYMSWSTTDKHVLTLN